LVTHGSPPFTDRIIRTFGRRVNEKAARRWDEESISPLPISIMLPIPSAHIQFPPRLVINLAHLGHALLGFL
jgi:hypothetical protein